MVDWDEGGGISGCCIFAARKVFLFLFDSEKALSI